MSKIITVANQKGGVSKTTVCQHLSYALTERGLRVLCVDFDPQANLTLSMLSESAPVPELDIYGLLELLLADHTIPAPEHYIAHTKGGDIIPGSKALARLESALLNEMGTEGFLKSILHPLRTSYDYILIDTNRAASPLMVNALTAADSVLIPINPEFYSKHTYFFLLGTVAFRYRAGLFLCLFQGGVTMNPNSNPTPRPHDPFDDSARERQKRMGLLTAEGQPSHESLTFFCTLYAGLFFDDLCDRCGDFETAIAVCRNLIDLSHKEEPRRMLLALSVQYDAMQRSLPDPIWWITGNTVLVTAFTQGFAQRLQILADSEVM